LNQTKVYRMSRNNQHATGLLRSRDQPFVKYLGHCVILHRPPSLPLAL
jgi:hypothetical protein